MSPGNNIPDIWDTEKVFYPDYYPFSRPLIPNRANRNVKFVILHYTVSSTGSAIETFSDPSREVSSHYLVSKNGDVIFLVDENMIAWHAGIGSWLGEKNNMNEVSIGIEIENQGPIDYKGTVDESTEWDPYTKEQMIGVRNLCQYIKAKYKLEATAFLGHSDYASQRKIDPGPAFNWQFLAEKNIGIFPPEDMITGDKKVIFSIGSEGDAVCTLRKSIRKLGYEVADSRLYDKELANVAQAFNARYLNWSSNKWNNISELVLNWLLSNYYSK